jgi:hypothetical protein
MNVTGPYANSIKNLRQILYLGMYTYIYIYDSHTHIQREKDEFNNGSVWVQNREVGEEKKVTEWILSKCNACKYENSITKFSITCCWMTVE